jgi:hypothetical protein
MLSPEAAKLIGTQLKQVTSSAGGALGLATVIGILTALWSASSGMKALITGVNLAYDETEGRKFVKLGSLSILMTLGAMVLLGVALALIVGFPAVPDSWPTGLGAAVGDGCVQVAIGGGGWLGGELQPVDIAAVDPLEPARGNRFCHGDQAASATNGPLPLRVQGTSPNAG